MDPGQQLGRQLLIALNDLPHLQHLVQDLMQHRKVGSGSFQICPQVGPKLPATSFLVSSYLPDPLPLHSQGLHLGEIVVERDHIGNDGLLIWGLHVHIWGVKEWGSMKVSTLTEGMKVLGGRRENLLLLAV